MLNQYENLNNLLVRNVTKNVCRTYFISRPFHSIKNHHHLFQVDCYKLRIIGVFSIFLFILSIIFNSLLLAVFFSSKKFRSSNNIPLLALTFLNLIGSILEYPFVIISNLKCK
jgi:hypothetical protein